MNRITHYLMRLLSGKPVQPLTTPPNLSNVDNIAVAQNRFWARAAKKNEASSKRLSDLLTARTLRRLTEDIDTWRKAITWAENLEYPQRRDLARVYREILTDAHLSAVIAQRKEKVLGATFEFVDKQGVVDSQTTELFQHPWFADFVRYCLDSIFWGYMLIELGVPDANGLPTQVTALPQQHLEPLKGYFFPDPWNIDQYIAFRNNPMWVNSLIEINNNDCNLGLLSKAAPHVLWKKNAQGWWAEYSQLFGMPVRIGKTLAHDEQRKQDMADMLEKMGAAGYGVFDADEQIEFVETAKGDAFQVYDRLVERCNTELSKLVVGQTMTTDSGSSRAQATVHETRLNEIYLSDLRLVERTVNTLLLPRLLAQGATFGTGIRFRFSSSTSLDQLNLRWLIDKGLMEQGFQLTDDYLRKTYLVEGQRVAQ